MSEAPTRIWLDYKHSNLHWMAFEEPPNGTDDSAKDEYVRADLADAWAKDRDRLRAELAEAQLEREEIITKMTEGLERIERGALGMRMQLDQTERDRDAAKAEAERLREALRLISSDVSTIRVDPDWPRRIARAALQEKPHD